MKAHTEAVQHSSLDPNWRTPPALFAALDREFSFLIDAAADKTSTLCSHYFGSDHHQPALRDGLHVNWAEYLQTQYQAPEPILDRTAVFLNPPYSRSAGKPIAPWIEKAWQESQHGVTVVGVIPYSPQTTWWRQYVEGHGRPLETFHAARETRKIPHRVTFLRPDGTVEGNAGGNTAVVVWKAPHGICAPWVPWSLYWDYL